MRFKSLLAVTGALAALVLFAAAPAVGQTKPICANCHEAKHQSIALTAHGAKNDANGSMCQACHGDASEHVKDPTKVKMQSKLGHGATAAEKSAVCMTCHQTSRHLAFWESGKHANNDVSCASCHNIHGAPRNPGIGPLATSSRPNESEICGSCHKAIRAATMKPSHHPIIEGKVKCSDCHNPHGSIAPVMLRNASVNEQCTSCHADKRGPFVFSHPPVEENCVSCHNPHGSPHYKLLNEHTPNLCQDCHDWSRHPGTIYGAAGGFINPSTGAANAPTAVNTRLIERACLNCHNAIHGSNAPGNRGKFFTR